MRLAVPANHDVRGAARTSHIIGCGPAHAFSALIQQRTATPMAFDSAYRTSISMSDVVSCAMLEMGAMIVRARISLDMLNRRNLPSRSRCFLWSLRLTLCVLMVTMSAALRRSRSGGGGLGNGTVTVTVTVMGLEHAHEARASRLYGSRR